MEEEEKIIKTKISLNKTKISLKIIKLNSLEKAPDMLQTHHIPVVTFISPEERKVGTVKSQQPAHGRTKLRQNHEILASVLK